MARNRPIVTVDCMSGYFKTDLLTSQTAFHAILKLQMAFARFGVPYTVVTDNAPMFASREFAQFTKTWCFEHKTSSPHHPQGNGQAEAAVKVAKQIITKAKQQGNDVYKALLDYRNTPRLSTGLSSAQVLLQHKTPTATLPQQPEVTTTDTTAQGNKQRRQDTIKRHHDKSARPLAPIPVGAPVWFIYWAGSKERWIRGTVQQAHARKYTIKSTETEGVYYRNRIHIKPDNTATADSSDDETIYKVPTDQPRSQANQAAETADGSLSDDERTCEVPVGQPRPQAGQVTEPIPRSGHGYGFVPPNNTRSGRTVKPVSL